MATGAGRVVSASSLCQQSERAAQTQLRAHTVSHQDTRLTQERAICSEPQGYQGNEASEPPCSLPGAGSPSAAAPREPSVQTVNANVTAQVVPGHWQKATFLTKK